MGIEQAIENALEGEKRGLAYYESIAAGTSNMKLKALAEEFAAEEREHVAELERVLQRQRQGTRRQTGNTNIPLTHNQAQK